jgi:recombination protein RecT
MNQLATAEKPQSPITAIRNELQRMDSEFESVLPRGVRVEEFRRVVLNAIQERPELLAADRQSFMRACLDCARDGNVPDGKEAFFDIRNTKVKVRGQGDVWIQKVVYVPMIRSFYKRTVGKTLKDWRGDVVCENDHFELVKGDEERFIHRPDIFGDRGKIIGAYSIAVMLDGTISREFMSYRDLMKAKEKSPTVNSPNGPWVTWEDRMCIKTVVKRHSVRLPMTVEAEEILRRDDEANALEIAPPAKPAAIAGKKATQQLQQLPKAQAVNGHHQPQESAPEPEEDPEPMEVQAEEVQAQQAQEGAKRGRPSNADREARARRQAEEDLMVEAARPAQAAAPKAAAPVAQKSPPPSATSQKPAGQRGTPTPNAGGVSTASPSEPEPGEEGTPEQAAYAQGAAAFNAGMERKPPRQLTAANRFKELSAWYDGYDEAESGEGQEDHGEEDHAGADAWADRTFS